MCARRKSGVSSAPCALATNESSKITNARQENWVWIISAGAKRLLRDGATNFATIWPGLFTGPPRLDSHIPSVRVGTNRRPERTLGAPVGLRGAAVGPNGAAERTDG